MATIPLWAIGKHITAITFTPQSVNTSTGVLTDLTGTSVKQFYGHCAELSLDSQVTTENISAINRTYANNVGTESDTTLKVTEFEKSAGANLAADLAFTLGASGLVKFVLTRGTQSFTGYGILTDYSLNTSGKGSIKADLTVRQIDTGSDAPLVYG